MTIYRVTINSSTPCIISSSKVFPFSLVCPDPSCWMLSCCTQKSGDHLFHWRVRLVHPFFIVIVAVLHVCCLCEENNSFHFLPNYEPSILKWEVGSRLSTNFATFSLCLSLLPSPNGPWCLWVWDFSGVLGKNQLFCITHYLSLCTHELGNAIKLIYFSVLICAGYFLCFHHQTLRHWITAEHWLPYPFTL